MKKTVQEIYDMYNIMPNLRQHMFRVAAVGEMIADTIDIKINKQDIVTALLLHDIGNIVKFELGKLPEFLEPEGLTYWRQVQKRFRDLYGHNEEQAHIAIVRELQIPERVVKLIAGVGFTYMCHSLENKDWEQKICSYVDQRVAPYGVVSLTERLREGGQRYGITPENERWDLVECSFKLEDEIFSHCTIAPEDINDASIATYLAKYPDYVLIK